MKSILILIICVMVFPFMGSSQIVENIDEITPFHEELAAVRKADQWAFMNTNGEIAINYRDDLVLSKTKNYPYFNNGRCLIKQKVNDIYYYGYIDKSGKTVIEPEYLNAIHFDKGYAIVLKIVKEELGQNDILDKKVVSYSYDEVVIDPSGNVKTHLTGPEHLIFSRDKLKKRPAIQSYLLSPNLIAVKHKDRHWKVYALNASD